MLSCIPDRPKLWSQAQPPLCKSKFVTCAPSLLPAPVWPPAMAGDGSVGRVGAWGGSERGAGQSVEGRGLGGRRRGPLLMRGGLRGAVSVHGIVADAAPACAGSHGLGRAARLQGGWRFRCVRPRVPEAGWRLARCIRLSSMPSHAIASRAVRPSGPVGTEMECSCWALFQAPVVIQSRGGSAMQKDGRRRIQTSTSQGAHTHCTGCVSSGTEGRLRAAAAGRMQPEGLKGSAQ